MRHDAHYVEALTSYSGAAIGRMVPVDQVRPNPDQPRKSIGDLRELTDSIREKGVLEPLLVRFVPREDCYYIISGERWYHASRAGGLTEVPCIEKVADDAETLEIGLIENIQRKDLTPFEEAGGLHRLATQFDYTPEDGAGEIVGARDHFAPEYSRGAAEALRGPGDRFEVAALADCSAADRKENDRDDESHPLGRADSRRSAARTAGKAGGSDTGRAVFFHIP